MALQARLLGFLQASTLAARQWRRGVGRLYDEHVFKTLVVVIEDLLNDEVSKLCLPIVEPSTQRRYRLADRLGACRNPRRFEKVRVFVWAMLP